MKARRPTGIEHRMSDAGHRVERLYDLGDARQARIVEWRLLTFAKMRDKDGQGFDPTTALDLAKRSHVDPHYCEQLLGQGATHAQVASIVL